MCTTGAACIAVAAFTALALLHAAWALGLKLGGTVALPEVRGQLALKPGKGLTFAVALLLAVAAAVVALDAGLVKSTWLPHWIPRVGTAVLALVMLARFVGDFRYVGIFKRVCDTRFARLDTRFYSPLCFALAVACSLVVAGNRLAH